MIEELNGDFLQWLRGFYYVAKTGSVRKAADIMRRNPSTISYQLHSLEEELGTALFDRHKKTLQITQDGETVLKWAISTFETLQNLISSVGGTGDKLQGTIRMAATLPVASMSIKAISDFIRGNPEVDLRIERLLASEIRKAVSESEIDFGILPVIDKPEIDHLEVIAKSRTLLVMHRDNQWNVPPIPDIEFLSTLPYVAFADRNMRDDISACLAAAGLDNFVQKNAVVRVNNYHLMMRLVWQKLGVAVMDEMCFQGTCFGASWQNLETISLDHIFPNRLYGILTRKRKHITTQSRALMDAIKDYFLSVSIFNAEDAWDNARQRDNKQILGEMER